MTLVRKWQPSTAYNVGDLLYHRGKVRPVIVAGTSGPIEPINGTAIMAGAGTPPLTYRQIRKLLRKAR